MSLSLKHNLSSKYLEAAEKMTKHKRRRIIAYVESYDDISFWRSVLSEFENDERFFRVMLPSAKTLSKGKKMVLSSCFSSSQLGKNLIACVDSDYDYLLQGATDTSHDLNTNPFILQTYAYAIESYQCYAENLHDDCVEATLNDHQIFDFVDYLTQYSEIVYPLFLWNIYLFRKGMNNSFPMNVFCNVTLPQDIDVRRPKLSLDYVDLHVQQKLADLEERFPDHIEAVKALDPEIRELGVTPQTTYLFIKGHHIKENVVLKLLIPVCTILRREREEQIRRYAQHREQYENELAGYNHSSTTIEVILRKNDNYKDLFLYNWIRDDVKRFLELSEKEETDKE